MFLLITQNQFYRKAPHSVMLGHIFSSRVRYVYPQNYVTKNACYLLSLHTRDLFKFMHCFIISALVERVRRKTLVLDLDETLVHSQHASMMRPNRPSIPPDFVLRVSV